MVRKAMVASTYPSRRLLLGAGISSLALPFSQSPVWAQEAELVEGGKDQTARIQSAINEATSKGRPFVFSPGIFVTRTLTLPKGAHLVGRPGKTVLASPDGGSLFTIKNGDRITLEGLTLRVAARSLGDFAPLLLAEDTSDLRIDDCAFIEANGAGIKLERCGGRIERCSITDAAQQALFAQDSTGLSIIGNTIMRCRDNGILVWRTEKGDDGTIIADNRISDIGAVSGGTGEFGNGINVFRAGGVNISGNQIRRCRFSAVRNNGGSNVIITGNTCIDFDETALWHEFAFDGGTLTGNIVQNCMTAVQVANLGSDNGRLATVAGNVFRNCTRRKHIGDGEVTGGIGISAEGEVAITGNVIDAADYAGITIGWGPYLRGATVAENVINAPNMGIAVSVVPKTGSAVITGNSISGAKRPIAGTQWQDITIDDLAARAADHPNLVIANNSLRS
jgi:uncharacterized secreted repeat protein (TIGR03808 family)